MYAAANLYNLLHFVLYCLFSFVVDIGISLLFSYFYVFFFYCVRKSVIAREGVKGVESEQQQQPFGYA